jgi:hypothetical protein
VIRDQADGMYSEDESTVEFAARLRQELGIGTDVEPGHLRRTRRTTTPAPTVTR